MPSILFFLIATITALIPILGILFNKTTEHKRISLLKPCIFLTFLLSIFIISPLIFDSLITVNEGKLSELLELPEIDYSSNIRINELENQVGDLQKEIYYLKEENSLLKYNVESQITNETHQITFEISDYSGSITSTYSLNGETETVSIVLCPVEEYFIECVDSDNNVIETRFEDNGEWIFTMPDSNVTVYIKQK